MGFGEDPSIYQLNSLQHVHITEQDIHDKVKEMFAVLNIPKQPYQITDIESDSLLGSLVQVETKAELFWTLKVNPAVYNVFRFQRKRISH